MSPTFPSSTARPQARTAGVALAAGTGRKSWWSASGARLPVLAAVIAAAVGCTLATTALRGDPPGVVVSSSPVMLHGTPLTLHLARPAVASRGPLVLFASGDGGWYGRAIGMFRAIAARGYPVVGISARALLRIERPAHDTLSPGRLAADYATILHAASAVLSPPPEAGVILTGWSRGAAFAALAGTEPSLHARVRGIVAIGMAADETLTVGSEDENDDGPDGPRVATPGAFLPYARLRNAHAPPAAVIQAEHDDYLRAADARALFGPDTHERRLYVVAARNHSFAGGSDAFDAALADALAWLSRGATSTSAQAAPVAGAP